MQNAIGEIVATLAGPQGRAFQASNLTYEGLVKRSAMTPEQKRFWVGLGDARE
ncbi:MAG: hypothetical protein ABI442_05975 [Gemmatimonadaceae bacterium]